MVRLTVSGDVTQFSSKLNVDPKAWDVKLGKAAGNSVKARQLNELLENIRTSLKITIVILKFMSRLLQRRK